MIEFAGEHESDERNPVEVLVEEYLAQRRAGHPCSIEEFANRHPEHADVLCKLLSTIAAVERLKSHVCLSNGRPAELRIDKLEQLGDYRIIREIGRGGMGIVYEAEQQSLGRHVAVKVFSRDTLADSRHLRRFEREARTAASLHHTNIVPVFGVGEQDGLSYYVMQYIPGVGLDHVIREMHRLTHASPAAAPSSTDNSQDDDNATRSLARTAAQTLLSGSRTGFAQDTTPTGLAQSENTETSALSHWPHHVSSPATTEPAAIGSAAKADNSSGRGADGADDISPAEQMATNGQRRPQNVTSDWPFVFGRIPIGANDSQAYWRRVARIGVQVAQALHYAHREGVLHRDIKSANLLLDDHGRVWITDFGLATVVAQDRLSRSNDIVGTLRYMAPEQLGGKCDPRSDVYSLGLTLYELLVLHPAFDDSAPSRLLQRVSKSQLIPPRKLTPEIPADLETIVLKATATSPDERYQTAEELADDLQRFHDDHVILARRAGPLERLWRWSRRNPTIATLSAVLLIMGIASFATISWKWREAELERGRAQRENQRAEANLSLALDSMDEILGSWATSWMAHPADPLEGDSENELEFRIVVSDRMASTLKDALRFYDQFAAQNARNPRLQRDTADAHIRVGEIYQRLGQSAEAESAFRKAAHILAKQLELSPNDSELATLTAATYNQLGTTLLHVERFQVARSQFYRARAVLVDGKNPPPESRYELARTHSQLGMLSWRLWNRDEAVANHARAVELLEKLVEQFPKRAEYRLALADAYQHFDPPRNGKDYRKEGLAILSALVEEHPEVPDYQCELSEALTMPRMDVPELELESQLRQAVTISQNISDEYPTIPRYRATCARACHALGNLLQRSNRLDEADHFYDQAMQVYSSLNAEFPNVNVYAFLLARTLHKHGEMLRHLNQFAAARSNFEQAIAHQRQYVEACRQDAFGRGALAEQYESLAETLSQMGEHQKALQTLEKAHELQVQMRNQFQQWQRMERRQKKNARP